jgi:hypothetical protein
VRVFTYRTAADGSSTSSAAADRAAADRATADRATADRATEVVTDSAAELAIVCADAPATREQTAAAEDAYLVVGRTLIVRTT